MTCPARTPKVPRYTCWERIPQITDRREILLCQQCPYGRQLMATVAKATEFAPQAVNEQPDLQKETAVEQTKTYYMSELAALIGVDTKVLSNAKYSRGTPRPGSKIHLVLEKMKEMGITWENVVPACKRAYADPARSVTPEDVDPPLVERILESSTLELQTTTNVSEGDGCCADGPCDQSDDVYGSKGQPVPLELVLAELKSRLPGASITITIA